MSARLLTRAAINVAVVVLVASCASIRGDECGDSNDCWDGLTCVGFPAVCPAGCEPPKGKCERACHEERLCGPKDTCSTETIPVRSISDEDNAPVRICLSPDRDAGVR